MAKAKQTRRVNLHPDPTTAQAIARVELCRIRAYLVAQLAKPFFWACVIIALGGLVAWTVVEVFRSIAGLRTQVDLSLAAFLHASIESGEDLWLQLATAITALFGAGGIGYAYVQRWFRRKKVEEMAAWNARLEMEFDKKRTSSRLLPDGRTRPEDR